MHTYKTVSLILGGIILIITSAGASVYLYRQSFQPEKNLVHHSQKSAKKCNDDNIAGKVVGGVGGGLLGSAVGKGNGNTAATIGGALGGAYIGGKVIPLKNVTCE